MEKKQQAVLSPSVHEQMIARHFVRDQDDPVLIALRDAVALARQACEKATSVTAVVLRNEMKTPAVRHKEARTATFDLLQRATTALDEATRHAETEIKALRDRVKGPPPPRDLIAEARQRELRERLASLPAERRREVLADADEMVVGALLAVPCWVVNMTEADQSLVRHGWATRHHGADLDRLSRLEAAVEDDVRRAGSLSISFIDGLTDAELVARAEKLEKDARDAIAAAAKEAS